MTYKSHFLSPEIYQYLLNVSLREDPTLKELREATLLHPAHQMMTGADQSQLLAMLVKIMGAGYVLEVGTFTGYSTLSIALALPKNGQIITCDIDEASTQIAKSFWEKAGVDNKIDLKIGPALDTLDGLMNEGKRNCFDFVFIDADKRNNDNYYEKSLDLVRTGGLIAIDNVLWYGRVVDSEDQEKTTQAIREFNKKLHTDQRVDISMIPIGDGLTLARKVN